MDDVKNKVEKPRRRDSIVLQDLQSLVFLVALEQGLAYPLGLNSAASLAAGIQILAWIPSALARNEKFYDFTGMLSFIVLSVFSQLECIDRFFANGGDSWTIAASDFASRPSRHLVATALVLLWALRLGLFLFKRICKDGHDSRFNGVRDQPIKFLLFWCIQGLWVFLTPLPMLVLHKLDPKGEWGDLGTREAIGLGVWITGFLLEVIADEQKRAFKADGTNEGKYIDVGLWSRCRHPNYVGEMMIWVGFFVFCSRGLLTGRGWTILAGPGFVILLLFLVSTPMLEKASDKKYGGQAAYQEYKRRTPALHFRLW